MTEPRVLVLGVVFATFAGAGAAAAAVVVDDDDDDVAKKRRVLPTLTRLIRRAMKSAVYWTWTTPRR